MKKSKNRKSTFLMSSFICIFTLILGLFASSSTASVAAVTPDATKVKLTVEYLNSDGTTSNQMAVATDDEVTVQVSLTLPENNTCNWESLHFIFSYPDCVQLINYTSYMDATTSECTVNSDTSGIEWKKNSSFTSSGVLLTAKFKILNPDFSSNNPKRVFIRFGFASTKVATSPSNEITEYLVKYAPLVCRHPSTTEQIKPATCESLGRKDQICTACGYLQDYTYIPATNNHTYGEWQITQAATVDNIGEQERTCTVCNKKETQVIPKLNPPTAESSSSEAEVPTTETISSTTEEPASTAAETPSSATEASTTAATNTGTPKTNDSALLILITIAGILNLIFFRLLQKRS